MTALVSIFMPAYNAEAYIEAAIDSVLSQSCEDYQLIIGDDCSTDGTWSIIEGYCQARPGRISAYRNTSNLGIPGNCSKLLNRCNGEYIAFHAGDDLWLPDKLRLQLDLMQANPDCALSYHDVDVFDSKSGKTLYLWNQGQGRPLPVTGKADFVAQKVVENLAGFMGALSAMVRRSCLEPGISYDPRLPHQGELLIWLSALRDARNTVEFIPQVLARYRKHPQGVSQLNTRTQEDFFLAIVENELSGFNRAVRRARGRTYYSKGVDQVLAGDGAAGLDSLIQCFHYYPYSAKFFYWFARALKLRYLG